MSARPGIRDGDQRPLVAVAGMWSPHVEGLRRDASVAATRVLEALERAGGDAVVLPVGDRVDERLARFDAVVLPGGGDVDPSRYGAAGDPRTTPVDPRQDDADLSVARAALELGLPTLAICRGLQVVNVALGGTLLQHVDSEHVDHHDAFHDVHLGAGSRAAEVMGRRTVSVSSYHHQAVDRVADGLVVTGRAADGHVEVLEHVDRWLLAVQWHPEDDADTAPAQQALFDALVREGARTREYA